MPRAQVFRNLASVGLLLGSVVINGAGMRFAAAADITVLAGTAAGRPAESPAAAIVNEPFAVDFDAQGRLYGVEFTRGNRVFRSREPITADGVPPAIEFVAGQFHQTTSKTALPAAVAEAAAADIAFNGMHDLAVAADGRIFLADTFNHLIRVFDPAAGRVATLAGIGEPGFAGDGGPAAKAVFNEPYCGSLSPDSSRLLIADIRNHRLRVIDLAASTVDTVAGSGKQGQPIDGARATETPLAGPRAACEAADGTIYLVLREGNALVAIRDGRVQTVVNASGKGGYGGDGGPGREALLKGPKYVCMDREQRVLIVDTENHCIRRYDPATGRIDLVAGVPQRAGAAIGGDWKATELRRPHGVRIAPDGRLIIADSDNDRLLIGRY
jgi:DNA-binding beta-propeller fold protein YncE